MNGRCLIGVGRQGDKGEQKQRGEMGRRVGSNAVSVAPQTSRSPQGFSGRGGVTEIAIGALQSFGGFGFQHLGRTR